MLDNISRLPNYRHRVSINNRLRKRRLWTFLFKSIFLYGHCYWCERRLQFESATFDHNPPLSKGGNRGRGVISCYACNHKQSNKRRPASPNYIKAMEKDFNLSKRIHSDNKKLSQLGENPYDRI